MTNTNTPIWVALHAPRGWSGHGPSNLRSDNSTTHYTAARTAHSDFWVLYAETMPRAGCVPIGRASVAVVHVSFMQRAFVAVRRNGNVVGAPAKVAERAEAKRPTATSTNYTAKRAHKCTSRHCAGNGKIAAGERYAARTLRMYSWSEFMRACSACCSIGRHPE